MHTTLQYMYPSGSTYAWDHEQIGWRYSMKKNTATLNVKSFSNYNKGCERIRQELTTYFSMENTLSLFLDLRGYTMDNIKGLFFLFRLLKYFQNIEKSISVVWISGGAETRDMAYDFQELYSVDVTVKGD